MSMSRRRSVVSYIVQIMYNIGMVMIIESHWDPLVVAAALSVAAAVSATAGCSQGSASLICSRSFFFLGAAFFFAVVFSRTRPFR
jgi:hypothetical protein